MTLEDTLLQKLHDIKSVLARIVGTAEHPPGERSTTEELANVAAEYRKLTVVCLQKKVDWSLASVS